MGLGRVELPTSRLSGVRSNHLSYRPHSAAERPRGCEAEFASAARPLCLSASSLFPFPFRSLLGPEVVLFPLVELIVEVVVIVFVEILIVELVFIQIIIEVFVEFLVLFEFSELLVDVVAPALERPGRRRLAGLHCPPPAEVSVERLLQDPCPTTPLAPASRCGPTCGARSRPATACGVATSSALPRSARRPRCTPAPAPRSSGVAAPR